MKLTGDNHSPLLMTRLDSGGQSSKVKVTTVRDVGIHVDVRPSKSISSYDI